MGKVDGLIIPRSYNDYINKSDPLGVSQALALNGVMDAAPTENSEKPAKSGGIYAALAGKQPILTFDDVPTDGSANPAKSGGIYAALAGKQPALTFDDVPTDGSNNPVKSGGIFAANAVIMASGATLSGVAISAGTVVRVLFTAALTGSDATTGLTLTYNGNTYAVKVGKNGALANFLANNIDGSYIYCQAYTTLELMFDGSQFIIMGNPVVISSADYTIYTDGTNLNLKDFAGLPYLIKSSGYAEIYNNGNEYRKVTLRQAYRRPILLFITDSTNNYGMIVLSPPIGTNDKIIATWITGEKILNMSVGADSNENIILYFKQRTAKIATSLIAFSRNGKYTPTFGASELSNFTEFNSGKLVTDRYLSNA